MGIDPDFFDMFPTVFIDGDLESFNDFSNVIISRSLAEKIGGENVIGRVIKDEFYGDEYRVGAVIEGFEDTIFDNIDIIHNTRAPRFDKNREEQLGMWSSGMLTFIKVAEGTDITELTAKLDKMHEDNLEERYRRNEKHFSLTRLDKLYVADTNDGMMGVKKGNKGLMTAFSIIVAFLLISAIFNYINLNTALAGRYLETFIYRMDLPVWIFVTAAVAVFAISLISVLWQTLRAARTNPAEALKKE